MMEVPLPKDHEGREIPLDTLVLYDAKGGEMYVSSYRYQRDVLGLFTGWNAISEERRKIANRLRGLDSKIGDRDTLSTAVDELRMAVCGNAAISPVEYSVRNLVGFALELADLIEDNQYSGTCRNVYPNNEDHHCDNGFMCSACGDIVEDCENYRVLGTWNYCPKCRAKVVG